MPCRALRWSEIFRNGKCSCAVTLEFRFRFSAFGRPSSSPPMGFTTGSSISAHAKSRRTESLPYQPRAPAARARAFQPDPSQTRGINQRRQRSESPPYWPEVPSIRSRWRAVSPSLRPFSPGALRRLPQPVRSSLTLAVGLKRCRCRQLTELDLHPLDLLSLGQWAAFLCYSLKRYSLKTS